MNQLGSLASDASNKYIIRVRDLNDKDQNLNVGARMKNIAETINSDAVAGAELVVEAMKTKEGRASLRQTAKDKVVSTKNKIDKTSVDERAIMITMAGAELIQQEQPGLSLEDAYLESATILEDTITQHKNDPNFKKAVDNYDSSVVMDKGLPRYLRFKAAMKKGLQGAKTAIKAIDIGLGIIAGIPILAVGAVAFAVGLAQLRNSHTLRVKLNDTYTVQELSEQCDYVVYEPDYGTWLVRFKEDRKDEM